MTKRLCCLLLVLLSLLLIPAALAQEDPQNPDIDLTRHSKVLKYIKENQPMYLNMGETKFSVKQLKTLKNAMPEGSTFKFTIWFCQSWIDSEGEVLDLDNSKAKITKEEFLWLLENMPNVREVYSFRHRELSNDLIPGLMEQYPHIKFNWIVRVSSRYYVRSDATAFSTQKKVGEEPMLSEKTFENLKYVPGLRALDIGHNSVRDLSWVQYLPELRILILADNKIRDYTPLAQLEHLEYLELFMNYSSDIAPLAQCKNLKDLNLCRLELKNVDLSVLDVLELERFWCTQAGVTPEEQERFIAANPETYCNFTIGSCTDHGWRDSYKYDQFRAMFKSGVWTEFVRPEE